MGKYYGPEWIKSSHDWLMSIRDNPNDNQFSEWLYGSYSEDKLDLFRALYSVPVLSSYMDYLLDRRDDQKYMERYGVDYGDIYDPRKLRSTSSGSQLYRSGYLMISRNVSRLYR